MISKYTNIWANSGEKGTAPTTAKQDTGFVRREKPTRQLFNLLLNQIQTKLNSLIDSTSTTYDQLTQAQREEMIATKLWDGGWATGYDDVNQIDVGAGITVVETEICFIDSEPYLLALCDDNKIRRYNSRTKALVDTSQSLTTDISLADTVHSMCVSGTDVYVFVRETSSGTHMLGKWDIESFVYDSNWSTGGQPTSVTYSMTSANRSKLIVASSGKIALCFNDLPTVITYQPVQVYDMDDGTRLTGGIGDATSDGSNNRTTGEICSDGTNLYFTTKNSSSGDVDLCTVTIADATAGCGGTGYPYNYPSDYEQSLCCAGGLVFSIISEDHVDRGGALSTGTPFLTVSNATNAFVNWRYVGEVSSGVAVEYSIADGCLDMLFDGKTIWLGTRVQKTGTPAWSHCVTGFDVQSISQFILGSPSTTQDFVDIMKGPYFVKTETGTGSLNGLNLSFDGRDLWCSNGQQYVYRLPQITSR